MDWNYTLREVQLAFNEVDRRFFSRFESYLRMICQGRTYWSNASRTIEGRAWSFYAYRRPFAWYYDWECFIKLIGDKQAAINTWGLRNPVACFEEPHTMCGARHTAGFRCIHGQSQCKRPHQVLGSPCARSAIWREWEHRHWEVSKTSNRGQR